MDSKNTKELGKRATYQGLLGQIIGTPIGTYAGYKLTGKLTDNKALRICGAIAGAIAGNRAGNYLGDMLNEKRMQQQKELDANRLGPKDVQKLIGQSSRDRLQSGNMRMQLRKLVRQLKAQK